jgi:hypothetical protein
MALSPTVFILEAKANFKSEKKKKTRGRKKRYTKILLICGLPETCNETKMIKQMQSHREILDKDKENHHL